MNKEEIKNAKSFANELRQEAVILEDTKYMSDLADTLLEANKVIEKLIEEVSVQEKMYKDIVDHAIVKADTDKEEMERCWSIILMYRTLLGDDVANMVEQSAKRFQDRAVKKGEKQ